MFKVNNIEPVDAVICRHVNNIINTCKGEAPLRHALEGRVVDVVVNRHYKNMIAYFGKEYTDAAIKEFYNIEVKL